MLKSAVPTGVEFTETLIRGSWKPALICFSHLRWDFVFQRPQHLMTRFAKTYQVTFWEEPVEIDGLEEARLDVRPAAGYPSVSLVTPQLPPSLADEDRDDVLAGLLHVYAAGIPQPIIRWYYTPMMLPFSRALPAAAVVFDAMDELSAFRFAPPRLLELEQQLIDSADLVFTGGYSLFEAKKHRHPATYCFPSSVDKPFFATARTKLEEPADQQHIATPRFGFYGVLDERFDIALLDAVAAARPDYSFVMVGPVVKISPDDLPRRDNIHYLGGKNYAELPAYLSGWDVALMPFAMNESTRFISPTKTPEYLSGGRPVVSTPIHDVVRQYGRLEAVKIAADADAFVSACDEALSLSREGGDWLAEADAALAQESWEITQAKMAGLIDRVLHPATETESAAMRAPMASSTNSSSSLSAQ